MQLVVAVQNMQAEHAAAAVDVMRDSYGDDPDEWRDCDICLQEAHFRNHSQQFPEGQFVALVRHQIVGMALTMRTSIPPEEAVGVWMDAIGGLEITNHDPEGDWLYGVEFAVRPSFRRRGIGTKLYKARFDLVKRLKLKGFYFGGMLMGYHRFEKKMPPLEYGTKVIAREIKDPTVTMQMNRGFKALRVMENYLDEEMAGNAAVLMVWQNVSSNPS